MSKVNDAKKQKQTYFNLDWLNQFQWVKQGSNKTLFGCKWCNKSDLRLGNIGKRALRSHMKAQCHDDAKKHQEEIQNFFQKHAVSSGSSTTSQSSSTSSTPAHSQETSEPSLSSTPNETEVVKKCHGDAPEVITLDDAQSSSASSDTPMEVDPNLQVSGKSSQALQTTIQHGVCTSQVMKAEIIWCLRTVMNDCSNSSNEDISVTFRCMFPDDKIAENFNCGKDKTKYLVNFGITPWIKELLHSEVEKAVYIVAGFDESLNKSTQTCQMDVNVRYWDPVDHLVKIRFWDS